MSKFASIRMPPEIVLRNPSASEKSRISRPPSMSAFAVGSIRTSDPGLQLPLTPNELENFCRNSPLPPDSPRRISGSVSRPISMPAATPTLAVPARTVALMSSGGRTTMSRPASNRAVVDIRNEKIGEIW